MGANTYIRTAKGTNIEEVFERLRQNALMEHGYDSYNGTISTTSLGERINLGNNQNYEDLSDEKLFSEKWKTNYADLGVSHYEAFTPKWVNDPETPKRVKGVKTLQKFGLSIDGRRGREFDTLGAAKLEAKKLSLHYGKNVTIKKFRSDYSAFKLGEMKLTSDGKEYKSARKAKTKIYKPIHNFALFVYASC